MEVDYRLVVDNLMDLSHAAFLHRGIIGNEDTLNVDLDIIEDGDTLYVNRTAQAVEPTNDDSVSERLSIMRRFAFDEQDRPILEAQQRAVERAGGPDKISPVMLSIDTAPLRARRILSRLIDAERGPTLDGADELGLAHLPTLAAAAGGG